MNAHLLILFLFFFQQPHSKFLCVSSDKATVHVFKTDRHDPSFLQTAEQSEQVDSWSGYFTSSLSSALSYIAPSLPEIWTEERSFATASLEIACENSSTLIYEDGQLILVVFTSFGDLCMSFFLIQLYLRKSV